MPKKQITNEDLARMLKKGFDNNRKWFDRIDSRFDKIEAKPKNFAQGQKKIKLKL